MIKKLLPRVLLVGALMVGAASCAASNVSQSKFESTLKSKAKLTQAQAACIATAVFKEFPKQSDINKLYTSDQASELPAGVGDKFQAIVASCVKKS